MASTTSLDELIPHGVICSQELRAFFQQHIGKGFHFKVEFQKWLSLPTTRAPLWTMPSGAGTGRRCNREAIGMNGATWKQLSKTTYIGVKHQGITESPSALPGIGGSRFGVFGRQDGIPRYVMRVHSQNI